MSIQRCSGVALTLVMATLLVVVSGCKDNSGPEPGDIAPVPFFSLETGSNEIQNDPKIPGLMTIKLNDKNILQQNIGVEYRGSTSQQLFEKKSYSIETWDVNGADMDVSILGMPEEEDWILSGPYSDKTLIRNLIIYEFAREMGQYAPRTEIAEVEVNGDYMGAYIFMEKIKRDNNRLDLFDLDPEDVTTDLISGGYVIKIDKTAGEGGGDASYTPTLGFRSYYGVNMDSLEYAPYGSKQGEETYFLYDDPAPEDINGIQKEYIQAYVRSFENALITDDFNSIVRTYTNYIDLDSFVDFFILNEMSGNPDAYRLSTYMHKDRDGKLKMGPVWDFNIAFGNDGRSVTDQWVFKYNERVPNDLWLVPFWWERMFSDPVFTTRLKTRWNEVRATTLSSSAIQEKVAGHVNRLRETGVLERNFERWDIIGVQLPFNSYVGETYKDEVDYLTNWMMNRMIWMDQQISDL